MLLQQRMSENTALKQAKVTAKQSYEMKSKRMESQKKQQEEMKRKQREHEGIYTFVILKRVYAW